MSMTSPFQARRESRGIASLLLLTLLTALVFAALVSLGTWQVHRLAWKEALIARVAERIAADPVPLPARSSWSGLQPDDIDFRRVVFDAAFDNAHELDVFIALSEPKGPIGGQGYFVVTPTRLADGTILFVNRGFVPLERKDPATRPAGAVEGSHRITGLMRPPDIGNMFTPTADVAKNVWFRRDPAQMAAALGLDPARVAPFTVDESANEAPGGLPQGGETIVSFPNSHLQYAVTWYGLAVALLAIYASMVWRQLRPRGVDRARPSPDRTPA